MGVVLVSCGHGQSVTAIYIFIGVLCVIGKTRTHEQVCSYFIHCTERICLDEEIPFEQYEHISKGGFFTYSLASTNSRASQQSKPNFTNENRRNKCYPESVASETKHAHQVPRKIARMSSFTLGCSRNSRTCLIKQFLSRA